METLHIAVDRRGVARLTMTRPEVFNAFNEAMIAELGQAIERLTADPHVRLIVLAGSGKAFSAGADLQWMKRASEASQPENVEDARRFAAMLQRIAECPKPTIARVQGLALGGGVGLAVACDI
ncbi:MAG TPA: enoyl-CoA hydratase-related protein, partial [Roseateles sp.]|nr:enoyl-CoA hydratase-related protein [Roseateles sp.]